jgi:hypothetical protein
MIRALLLVSLVLLGACAKPVPVASQSACLDTMRDVDRTACWVSAGPEPLAPAGQKPSPPLLRGSDGKPIIGP